MKLRSHILCGCCINLMIIIIYIRSEIYIMTMLNIEKRNNSVCEDPRHRTPDDRADCFLRSGRHGRARRVRATDRDAGRVSCAGARRQVERER